jgi:hypothetical protein
MWLPKDERRLLAGYLFKLERPERELLFEADSWIPVLGAWRVARFAKTVPEYGEKAREEHAPAASFGELKTKAADLIKGRYRVQAANASLEARGLIKTSHHDKGPEVFWVALTVPGWHLGRNYGNWFTSTGEWFKEYREHWIWLIVGFVGGILGSLVVKWLS